MKHKGNDGNFDIALRGLIKAMVEISQESDSTGRHMASIALQNWDHERGYDWVVDTKRSLGILKNGVING